MTGGAFTFTGTLSNNTAVTFPTSGTLATTSQIPSVPISLANGGTSASLTASNGGIFYSSATAGAILSGTATANQVLLSGSSTTPAWSTATYPATTTINQLLYSSSANVVSGVSAVIDGVLISNHAAGVPSFLGNGTAGFVLTANSGAPPSWQAKSNVGTVTQFDVLVGGASSAIASVGPGTAGQVLQSAGNASNPAYSTPTYPSASGTSGKILISDGTNNIYSTPTYPSAAGTSGNVLTSNGTNWTSATPASSSISITGNTGGALTGSSFTFSGGTTGLSFGGSGSTETLSGTVVIANGGTNATSFTQSNGIVTFNGTSLVNYAGPQISSGGIQTNTTQPAFLAYSGTSDSNVTGDGTNFVLGSGNALTELYDVGNNFNTNGTFTAPVTGIYHFDFGVLAQQTVATMEVTLYISVTGTSARGYITGNTSGIGATGNYAIANSRTIQMTATDTATVTIAFANGAKVVDIFGSANDPRTYFSGYLVC